MAQSTIIVPETLVTAIEAGIESVDLSRWALEALVVEAVREGLLSTGEAGESLGLGYFQTEAFLKKRGVPTLLSDTDFERDQADLREIVARSSHA